MDADLTTRQYGGERVIVTEEQEIERLGRYLSLH